MADCVPLLRDRRQNYKLLWRPRPPQYDPVNESGIDRPKSKQPLIVVVCIRTARQTSSKARAFK